VSLLRRSSARYHLQHPTQLALTALGVALGVAVVVAVHLAVRSSRAAFRASVETVAGRATHVVTPASGGLDERLIRHIRVDLGIDRAAPIVEGYATSAALPGRVLRVLGVDPFSEAPFRAWAVDGSVGLDVARFVTAADGVMLPAGTAAGAGVRAGDTLPVSVNGRPWTLRVAGLVDPKDALTSEGVRDLLLVDIATAQTILGMTGRLSRIDLWLPDDEAGRQELARVRSVLPPDARLEPAGARADVLRGMIDAFDLNLTALSLLALIFGMFLVYNAMTFSVVRRREMLGGLRALGVTRRQIVGIVLAEAALIGGVGAVLGTLLGVGLGRGLVGMVLRTVNDLWLVVSVERLTLPPVALSGGVLLGILATLVASLPPAVEAATSPPRLARMRSTLEERARRMVPRAAALGSISAVAGVALVGLSTHSLGVSFAALFLLVLGLALLTPLATVVLIGVLRPVASWAGGLLGTMASRGVVTTLSRTAPAVAALVVALSVTVGLGVMIDSFRGTLTRWLDATLQADLYVSLPSVLASRADGTLDPVVVEALIAHPAVEGHSTYRSRDLRLGDRLVRLVAVELDRRGEAGFDFVRTVGDRTFDRFRTGDGVLVSEPLAYRMRLSVEDGLELPTPDGVSRLRVLGVFRDYGSDQGVVMMSRSAFDRLFRDTGVTSLGLFLAPGVDLARVVSELEARVASVGDQAVLVRPTAALREGSLQVFERTFRVTAVLRMLALIVAFVGVLSALMALELERARELGVLRSIGLTPGQVWGLVTTQTGLLGFVAGILSLPIGVVLSIVMIEVINRRSFGWSLDLGVGAAVLAQAVALALVAALLAGLYPAWRMSRASPAAALRGE